MVGMHYRAKHRGPSVLGYANRVVPASMAMQPPELVTQPPLPCLCCTFQRDQSPGPPLPATLAPGSLLLTISM